MRAADVFNNQRHSHDECGRLQQWLYYVFMVMLHRLSSSLKASFVSIHCLILLFFVQSFPLISPFLLIAVDYKWDVYTVNAIQRLHTICHCTSISLPLFFGLYFRNPSETSITRCSQQMMSSLHDWKCGFILSSDATKKVPQRGGSDAITSRSEV